MPIIGLSPEDTILLLRAKIAERYHPSRCKQCLSTQVVARTCHNGRLCDHRDCQGGGRYVWCEACGEIISFNDCQKTELPAG